MNKQFLLTLIFITTSFDIAATTVPATPTGKALLHAIQSGQDINVRITADGKTPLMIAALLGAYEDVQILLEHKADERIKDNNGMGALEYALIGAQQLINKASELEAILENKNVDPEDKAKIENAITEKASQYSAIIAILEKARKKNAIFKITVA